MNIYFFYYFITLGSICKLRVWKVVKVLGVAIL